MSNGGYDSPKDKECRKRSSKYHPIYESVMDAFNVFQNELKCDLIKQSLRKKRKKLSKLKK